MSALTPAPAYGWTLPIFPNGRNRMTPLMGTIRILTKFLRPPQGS